jgi:predicted DNA-binding protein (MmcQ/YjbR family)
MNIEELRKYCLSKKGVTESFPFDEVTLVFKVMDKIFALVNIDSDLSINLKCQPEKALELREHFHAVIPGYHMNKTHWNTVNIDGSIEDKHIYIWIDDSYNLIVSSLTKKQREQLSANH